MILKRSSTSKARCRLLARSDHVAHCEERGHAIISESAEAEVGQMALYACGAWMTSNIFGFDK
jgi:hypothetical protein